ncbi:MAG: glycosyltransferase family 2 protein [Wenzhouxiangellaceae bacterium]|nr:glycosyltransferase family 2 protein [Wenzhouxiangellaceae bacterium]
MTRDANRRAAQHCGERVAVVVLNFNGTDDTLACLESLAAMQPAPGAVHVVDNASEDDAVQRIGAAFPQARISRNRTNLGFGAGLDPVLERLLDDGPEWIWLLNNDTRAAPDTLARLLAHASTHPDAGAVGARILDMQPPHAIQTWGGGRILWWGGTSRHFVAETADGNLDYITGASLLLRAAALRETGLFDPRFFLYWEDVDLCLRLRKQGWKLTVAADAVVHHELSGSTGEGSAAKDRLINASGVRFFRKHAAVRGWPAILIGTTARIVRRILRGDLEAARAVLRGARDGFTKTPR